MAEGLLEIHRETDRQIGRIVEAAAPSAVLVFALHGMRPLLGVPTVLGELLQASGLAALQPSAASGRSVLQRSMETARRLSPDALKHLYHRVLSPNATFLLAQPAWPVYDWSRTRAFPLAPDQHGWVRINVAGREALGVVPPARYEETRDEVERALRGARTEAGEPIVSDVVRPPHDPSSRAPSPLPDLVAHWTEAAEAAPLHLAEPPLTSWPATGLSGQHAFEGFVLAQPHDAFELAPDGHVEAAHLQHLLRGALRRARE